MLKEIIFGESVHDVNWKESFQDIYDIDTKRVIGCLRTIDHGLLRPSATFYMIYTKDTKENRKLCDNSFFISKNDGFITVQLENRHDFIDFYNKREN